MTRQENQGDLWVLPIRLYLLPSIMCPGLWTLSLASVQSLGSRDPRLKKLALDLAWIQTWWTMSLKGGSTSSKWLYLDWDGLIGLSNKMIHWFSLIQHHNRIQSMLNKRTHQEISEIFWFIKPTRFSVLVYHFNHGWFLDFECWLRDQHAALKKY